MWFKNAFANVFGVRWGFQLIFINNIFYEKEQTIIDYYK